MRRLRSLGVVLLLALAGASVLAVGGSGASGGGLIVYVGPSSPPSLFVTNPESGATRRLTHGSDRDPAWSPDGQRIAFVRSDRVYVMNADGSGVRPVTRRMPWIISPDWSPDGKQIAFTACVARAGRLPCATGRRAINVVNIDGTGLRRLTTKLQRVYDLSWSSSGLIAVTSWGQPGMGIWAVRPDGTQLRQVTFVSSVWPTWSPDGSKIAYERPLGGLFVIRADGSGWAGLTSKTASYHHPTWSPDGTRIAYVAGAKQHYLWLMNSDGNHSQRLVRTTALGGLSGSTAAPDWQPVAR